MISQNDLNRSGRHLSTKFGLRKHSANDVERLCTDGQINQTSAQNTDSITSLAHIHSSRLLVDYQNDTLCYEGIDENEIIKPAVEGTLAALKAARLANVKRVVLTSSVGAIFGANEDEIPENNVFTEK